MAVFKSLAGSLEIVLNAKALVAESPVWDDLRQCLYWVDVERGQVHCLNPENGDDRFIDVGRRVGAVALRSDGGLVAALQDGLAWLDFDSGEIRLIGDPESHLVNNRFNDGKCDPKGRFWAGTMGMSRPRQPVGALYVLDIDRRIRQVIDQVSVSNGLAWAADQKTFYYIDTQRETVEAFDFEPGNGSLSNRRTIIVIAEGEGRPDGMTIDREGMLWVAHWGGWQIGRYDPATGRKLASVRVPVERVSSCTFGGPGLDWLYITTASEGLSGEEAAGQPLAGAIFRIRTAVCGRPADRYAG